VIGTLLLWFGGDDGFDGDIDDDFHLFYGLAYGIFDQQRHFIYGVRQGNAAAERVLEILHTENHIKDKKNAVGFRFRGSRN
jgi:subfamily B ATP-binding cassette protein MsbA